MMLGFQNFHQVVFNLSQVTSAFSSGSVRVTSSSAKKKPEIDVYCSESFLNTLKIFRQSENSKLFNHLPVNVKFGPEFDDIQWIYCKDINFKFTTEKSVHEAQLTSSYDKSNLVCRSKIDLIELKNVKACGKRQKNILANVETYIVENPTWSDTYVSKKSFNENKESSRCGYIRSQAQFDRTSPLISSVVGIHNLHTTSSNVTSIHKRGFRTNRNVELEERNSKGFFPKFLKNYLQEDRRVKTVQDKFAQSQTFTEMMEDKSLSKDDLLKLKISFAEGYLLADTFSKRSTLGKVLSAGRVIFYSVLAILCLLWISSGGKRPFISFNIGRNSEVNAEDVDVTFDDVKGVEEVKEELRDIVEFLKNPSKFSEMGGKLPKGVLLVGPPGTGKTLLAKAIAGEANVPFFQASGAEFDEIFVGEGARRVRNLFNSAKARAPSIIFIDEIDCVGSQRKNTMLHPYANQTINQLLSELDGFNKNEGVIVLGATNRKSDLDAALLRPGRFDVEVVVGSRTLMVSLTVPLPDLKARKEILELYISKIVSQDIDIEKIAKDTIGSTGADLQAIVNHAAIKAASEGASYVTMDHLENAKDKIKLGPERKTAMSNDDNLITAYHEGGHTVIAYFTEGPKVVNKVTIVPRGPSLGHTSVIPEKEIQYMTKAMYKARMDILLGGRAAEELLLGPENVTANASDDLQKATVLATAMVKELGMSEKIGLRTFKSANGELVSVNEYGQTVTDLVDNEIKRLIQESYERAKNLLRKHAKEHRLLAEALMKYKTLYPEDVRAILGENSTNKTAPAATTLN